MIQRSRPIRSSSTPIVEGGHLKRRGHAVLRLCVLSAALAHLGACKTVVSPCSEDQCNIDARCHERGAILHRSSCFRCVPEASRSEPTLVLDDACDRVRLAELCEGRPPPDTDQDGLCDAIDPCPLSDLNDADGDGECDGAPTAPTKDCEGSVESEATVRSWYPDCDGDGVHSDIPTKVCGGQTEANAAFDCADLQDPDGGWSETGGHDCDDEDATGTSPASLADWYPDCNGDGSFSPTPTQACGEAGANGVYDCADGQDPDGGWASTPGDDCADEPSAESPCWHDSAWSYRRRITILKSRVVGTSVFFPVLIDQTLANWKDISRGGHVAQTDAGDMLFTDADAKTRLSHEIERYDKTTGWLVAWVKMPQVTSARDSVIYAYYGNATPSLPNQEDPTAVWDDGGSGYFRAVWHLTEGGLVERRDSSGHDNGCHVVNYEGDEAAAGLIGRADDLDGDDDGLFCGLSPDVPSLTIRDAVTMSAWWKQDFPRLEYDHWDGGIWKGCYGFYTYGASLAGTLTTLGLSFNIEGNNHDLWQYGVADIPPGEWNHLVATFDGTHVKGYVNGALDFTVTIPGQLQACGTEWLQISAAEADDPTMGALDGHLDEARVSATARSADWIATEFNNQSDPAGFVSVGDELAR